MIDLSNKKIDDTTDQFSLFSEGMWEDTVKDLANVDVDKIKDTWNDASKGFTTKAKITTDEVLGGIDKTADDLSSKMGKHIIDNRSIIAKARESVMQFPVYVSNSISANAAGIIAGMFERVYATYVQATLALNPIMDEEEANNLVFLKGIHSNIKESAEELKPYQKNLVNKYYEAIDELDQMMCDSIYKTYHINENCTLEFKVVPTTNKDLIAENARLMHEPLYGFSYLKEAEEPKRLPTTETYEDTIRYDRITDPRELEDIATELGIGVDRLKDRIQKGRIKEYVYRKGEYFRVIPGNRVTTKTVDKETPVEKAVDVPKLLRDSDIKKINAMLPYTMEATFRIRTKTGLDRDIRYVLGVKTVMHLINANDLADELRELIMGNVKSLQKVRYKTGEISFKDYFLNLKSIKADAAKHIDYNKRWINTLKRLAEYQSTYNSLLRKPAELITKGNIPVPNGTLILSSTDVATLANKTGIDLNDESMVKKLAKSLFLIGVVIVDNSAGTMKVLFPDQDSRWNIYSLAAVDAEVAKTDNSQLMKELNRMVNR